MASSPSWHQRRRHRSRSESAAPLLLRPSLRSDPPTPEADRRQRRPPLRSADSRPSSGPAFAPKAVPRCCARCAISLLLVAAVFAQELLVFHFHSTDHAGVEGHFHWLLQLVMVACLTTVLLGVGFPRSFAVSLVRSACVTFHGVWLMAIGAMVWVPSRVPKECSFVHCHRALPQQGQPAPSQAARRPAVQLVAVLHDCVRRRALPVCRNNN